MEKEDQKEAENFINLGIVLNKNKEVLMIKLVKPEKGEDGTIVEWLFPGGRQRYGETREECVKRKILLRTGYSIDPMRQIALDFHPQFCRDEFV